MDERWSPPLRVTRRSASAAQSARMRIGNAEREQMAEDLKEHTHAGRLDLAEFEERVTRAYAARTVGDLAELTADLPPLHPEPFADPARYRGPHNGGFLHRASMGALYSYLSVCLLVVFVWAASGAGSFWPIWVIGPWGVMLLPSLIFGRIGRRRRQRSD